MGSDRVRSTRARPSAATTKVNPSCRDFTDISLKCICVSIVFCQISTLSFSRSKSRSRSSLASGAETPLGGFDSPSTGTQETSPVMVTLNGSIWKHPPLLACQKVSTVNSQPKSTLLEQCKNCELKHPSSEKLHRRIGGRRPTRHADRAPSIATTATRTAEVNFRCSRGKDFVRAPRAAADASKR